NPASESLTGWSPGDWVGRSFVSLLHPDDLPRMLDVISRAEAGESEQRLEARFLARSGAYVTGDFTIVGEPLGGGAVRTLVGVVREARRRTPPRGPPGAQDLERMRETEVELHRPLSLLSATLESTADGILVVDLGGRVTSYNRKFATMWRLPEALLATGQD